MKEIGGYIELDQYSLPMMHEGAIALNCGRNALAYVLRSKNIKKIHIPYFLCDSVKEVCFKEHVEVSFYSIGIDFFPTNLEVKNNEWVYIVNYYGQYNHEIIKKFKDDYQNIIVDNAQAYYEMPIDGVDTLYTCRKYFGVSDGAFLYTDTRLKEVLKQDESFERMKFILGRYERTATEFYSLASSNNHFFKEESIKTMSKLTYNLLHAIDYQNAKKIREENFRILYESFKEMNKLDLSIPEGPFMYPLYIKEGNKIKKMLQNIKIYVPTLWPDVLKSCNENSIEYDMANNILPLPIDQRYTKEDMFYIVEEVRKCLRILKENDYCLLVE